MSETKENESGAEAQAEAAAEALETETSSQPTESEPGAADASDDEGAEGDEAAAAESDAPKKKKKKRDAGEPEAIKDRNARVRAEAAEKRRSRREREQGTAPRRNLDASEVVDDALARSTHAAAGFLTKHFNKVQWVIMAGLVGWIGYEVYSWRHDRTTEKSTDVLFKALAAETGKVGSEGDAGPDRGGPSDTRRSFGSDEERLKAAKAEYVLASASGSSGTSVLADLGAAGVAYDLGQYKEAQAAYEKVKQHAEFARDADIKGRTLEGLAMSLEAQKNEDGALKAFKELQNMDSANFSALGMYHQARILKAQGKTEDATKLLEKAIEKLATLKETPGAIKYLGQQVLEILEQVDSKKAHDLAEKLISSEAKKKRDEAAALGAGPGGSKLTPDMQKKLQEMMEKMQKEQPPAPAPAPEAPMPGPLAPTNDAPAPANDAPAPAPSRAP